VGLEGAVLALQLADQLTPENQRVEIARADAAAAIARREQTAAVTLPAIPTIPRQIAGEDREQLQRTWTCVSAGAPGAVGSGGDTTRYSGIGVAEGKALLERLEGGRIGREPLGQ